MPNEQFIFDIDDVASRGLAERASSTPVRLLYNFIGRAIFEGSTGIQVKGTKLQLESLARAIRATREFHFELMRPEATVKSIAERLSVKNESAFLFEDAVGIKWPL